MILRPAVRITAGCLALGLAACLLTWPAANWSSTLPYRTKAYQWDDARAPMSGLAPGATPCNPVVFGTAGSVRVVDCAVGESMDGAIQLPHSYAEGRNIDLHIHWTPIDANAGNVRWGVDYFWLNTGDAAGVPTTITTGDVAVPGVAWQTVYSDFAPVLTGTGKLISSMIVFRVFRQAAGAGEYGSRAALLEVDAHFPMDSLGSAAEGTK